MWDCVFVYCFVFRRQPVVPSVLVLLCDVGLRVRVLFRVQTSTRSAQCAGLAL